MSTTYTAKDVAKWFLNRVDRDSGDVITHLKLQKLVYYTQAWHLAHTGKPLFSEEFKAWTHGPVTPSVWHEYKDFRWEPIPAGGDVPKFDPLVSSLLESVHANYGLFTAKALEDMTHNELPWKEARGERPLEAKCEVPISKETMKKFYRQRLQNGKKK